MDSHGVELTRFILMLSDALELAVPGMALHQTKTGFIVLRIADLLELPRNRKRDLAYAAFLHDIGALSPEEKIELHSPSPALIERHCQKGEIVLSRVGLFERVSRLVRLHHAEWNYRAGRGEDETFDANIIAMADTAELAVDRSRYILFQDESVRRKISAGRGGRFCPEIVDAFLEASRPEEFWLELASPRLPADFVESERFVEYSASIEEFSPISTLVRDIIDFRSTFTATHSSGVAIAAASIGKRLFFSEKDARALEIAGNLHDIGKMAVPTAILLKPAALDPEENSVMRQHPYQTWAMLSRSGLPSDIVESASWHHERLNGSGYPFRLKSKEITLGSRIVSVADVLTALAEDRPYRKALSRDAVLSTMEAQASQGLLEPDIVALVAGAYDQLVEEMNTAQQDAADFYRSNMLA